jgi:hydroxymethylbilane synthase
MLIGTRRSALALAQARWVAERLRAGGAGGVELVELTTSGDRGERLSDKARWVSELEIALHEGHIDVAVHSAKDVPADLAEGTELAAITEREDPRDAICGAAGLSDLAQGARVGTSSLRRAAQLHGLRPDLEIVALRGNVDTRLRKLVDGEADALILAAAGLNRLGRAGEIGGLLDELVPAAGQGALALQVRSADVETRAAVAALADHASQACVLAERELTTALGASCQTAVGAHCRPSGEQVELRGWVGLPDGSEWVSDSVVADAGEIGALVAERMLALGAAELILRAEALA